VYLDQTRRNDVYCLLRCPAQHNVCYNARHDIRRNEAKGNRVRPLEQNLLCMHSPLMHYKQFCVKSKYSPGKQRSGQSLFLQREHILRGRPGRFGRTAFPADPTRCEINIPEKRLANRFSDYNISLSALSSNYKKFLQRVFVPLDRMERSMIRSIYRLAKRLANRSSKIYALYLKAR
jgi:hypothetical protein